MQRSEVEFDHARWMTRRSLLGGGAAGVGAIALNALMQQAATAANPTAANSNAANQAGTAASLRSEVSGIPHFPPKAKRVIYLFQSGGPSHVDLFDAKPELEKLHGTDLPDSVRGEQRLTGMTSGQKSFPVVKPFWGGKRCGDHGTWISDLLPWTQGIANDMTIVRSMWTEAINH